MVKTEKISLHSRGCDEIFDITGMVNAALSHCGVTNGTVTVFVPGSTGAVTTIEFEPGVVSDLREALERAVPKGMAYAHDEAWGDGNGYSHVRAAWIGSSLTIPFNDGRMILGTWQQVVVLDCDNKPRSRQVVLQIIGE